MSQDAAVPPGFWDRIQRMIDKSVGKAMRSGPLRNSSISGGGGLTVGAGSKFVVQHPTGNAMIRAGIYDVSDTYDLPDGSRQPMFLLYRQDGKLAMGMYDPTPDPGTPGGYQQYLAIYDRGGKIIMSDDTSSGSGLARPYLAFPFYKARYADWLTTTAGAVPGTFEALFRARLPKQHPRLTVMFWASNDTAAATGEVRVMVTDPATSTTAQLGATQSTLFGQTLYTIGPLAVPVSVAHMAAITVEIQARMVTGTGGVRVEPARGEGWQSP